MPSSYEPYRPTRTVWALFLPGLALMVLGQASVGSVVCAVAILVGIVQGYFWSWPADVRWRLPFAVLGVVGVAALLVLSIGDVHWN